MDFNLDHINKTAFSIYAGIGSIGSLLINLWGGCPVTMQALMVLMLIDWLSGVGLALIFKKSNKTEDGAYESKAGLKGLYRKVMTGAMCLVAFYVDTILGATFFFNTTCIGFCVNEVVSIVENAGLAGVSLPKAVVDMLTVLKKKAEVDSKTDK